MTQDLLEYNEKQRQFHMNPMVNGFYKHEPDTNGYTSICQIEDELRADESFLDFRQTLSEQGVSAKTMKELVVKWVENWRKMKGEARAAIADGK